MNQELSAAECEELIAASIQALRSAWDVLAKALSSAFRQKFWQADGSWKAYCARTMGLDREFPKAIRDLLIVAMAESGVGQSAIAAAVGVNQSNVHRTITAGAVAGGSAFSMGQDGRLYERKMRETPEPVLDPVQADRSAMLEAVKGMWQATDRMNQYRPQTQGAAEQLRIDLRLMKDMIQIKLDWLDKNMDSLMDDAD